MEELPKHMKIDKRTYLILTTRGSSVDAAGLGPLLDLPADYIGVIGSKRRWATTVKDLKARGVSEERIGTCPLTDRTGTASRNARRNRGQHHG